MPHRNSPRACDGPSRWSGARALRAARWLTLVAALGCRAPHESPAQPVEAAAAVSRVPTAGELAGERISARWRQRLQQACDRHGAPGVSAAAVLPDGTLVSCAVGTADQDLGVRLTAEHRLLSGSIGKTYVGALALQLHQEGRLDLDAQARDLLADPSPLDAAPNGGRYTVRQLLRHESGLPRWVFQRAVLASVVTEPERTWTNAERMATIAGLEPLFAPGEGWAYSDTNYIVVGMILEQLLGTTIEEAVASRILAPEGLRETHPLDGRHVPRLAQGHVVTSREWGVPPRLLREGQFTANVQFEGCGGGWASTPADLARWGRALWSGRHLGAAATNLALEGVPAPRLGAGVRYGIASMVEATPNGLLAYHDGFQFGFLSSVGHYRDLDLTVAVQLDTDDLAAPGGPISMLMQDLAAQAAWELRQVEL